MKRGMPSGAQTPDGITFSCSNLFKTLSPIFSFTMGLTGHTRCTLVAVVQRVVDFRNSVQLDSGQAVVGVVSEGTAVQFRAFAVPP